MSLFFRRSARAKRVGTALLFAALPLSLLLVEVFGFLFLGYDREQFTPAQLWPLAFGGLWMLIVGGLLWLLPRKAARIFYGIFYFLMVLYAAFQTGYYLLFGQMMWLSDFRYASEGADYASVLLGYPAEWWLSLLVLVAVGVLLLWKFPRWERSGMNCAVAVLLMVAAIAAALVLPNAVYYFDYEALKDG